MSGNNAYKDEELKRLQEQFHTSGRPKRAIRREPDPLPLPASDKVVPKPSQSKSPSKRKTPKRKTPKSKSTPKSKTTKSSNKRTPSGKFIYKDAMDEPESESEFESESDGEWSSIKKQMMPESDKEDADDNDDGEIDLEELRLEPPPKKKKVKRKAASSLASEDKEEDWTEAELESLIKGLDEMRKRGYYVGVQGLAEKGEAFLQKNFLPTKTKKQIQTTVFASVYEHVLTQNKLPIDTWNDLFEILYPEEVLKESNEALSQILIDRAHAHTHISLKEKNDGQGSTVNDSSSDVNFAQIYKYLASVVVNDEEQPPLNPESAACLVDALEDLEKQAALVVNKELEEELNDAYCTLLMNLRKPPKALAKTAEKYTEGNPIFDALDPLALDMKKWTEHIQTELKKHTNLIHYESDETES